MLSIDMQYIQKQPQLLQLSLNRNRTTFVAVSLNSKYIKNAFEAEYRLQTLEPRERVW